MLKTLICTASFFALGFMASNAQTNTERYDKEMAKYKQTNTFENCVRPSLIKQTKVLDDQHIIFEMRNNRVYLNTLDHKCSRLGFERSITYNVRGGRLCSTDVVSVLDTTVGAGPGCFLGKFEILEKLPKDGD
tara:strand:- start:92948 stop:93346 length:399 start_codon:yes stop_codon:yes gene_type:complete